LSDYHVHLHAHGEYVGIGPPPGEYPEGHIEAYVETALSRGVEGICFTEHLYRCVEAAAVLGNFWVDEPRVALAEQTERFIAEDLTLSLDGYVDAVLAAKTRDLPVLLGLEVDFFPETIDAVLDLLSPYPWDLLIGSVHWLGGWSVDHPEVVAEFVDRGVETVYEEYFGLEAELAASGTVDVLAHVDLVKVFGHRLERVPRDLYRAVVDGAARSGTAVEVNTSGLRGLTGEIYPSPAFLQMFAEAGVGITLGSDAHLPEDAASGLEEGRELALAAGYTQRLEFNERTGTLVPL
jgi:histidinol-phosphatase (PHP family)